MNLKRLATAGWLCACACGRTGLGDTFVDPVDSSVPNDASRAGEPADAKVSVDPASDAAPPDASDADAPRVINGRVIDVFGGLPGVPVVVAGHATVTDVTGRFSVSGVPIPYTLALDVDATRTLVYQGLTTSTPIVRAETYASSKWTTEPRAMRLHNSSGVPGPGGTWLGVSSPFLDVQIDPYAYPGAAGAASANLFWYGPRSAATLYAMEFTSANNDGIATNFSQFGSAPIYAGSSAVTDLVLEPVTTLALVGSIDAPSTYALLERRLGLDDPSDLFPTLGNSQVTGLVQRQSAQQTPA